MVLVTCGTQAAFLDASRAASDVAHGGAWGFARVLRLEHTSVLTQSTDVSRGPVSPSASAMVACATEAEQACCGVSCAVARLRSCCSAADSRVGGTVSIGQYAITGGLGGLGLRAAALLMERR